MSAKFTSAYKTIGEAVKILNNAEPKQSKSMLILLRFWEKQFTQLNLKFC